MKKQIMIFGISSILALSNLQAEQKPEISLMFGDIKSNSPLNIDREKNIGLRIQCKKNMKQFSIGSLTHELSISRNISSIDYKNSVKQTDITRLGINAVLNFNKYNKMIPYALVGIGKEFVSDEYFENDDDLFINFGVGIKYPINNYAFRLEAQHIDHLDGEGERFGIFAGIAYNFGSTSVSYKDSDNDGVEDNMDQCLNTLSGVKVDTKGCAIKNINTASNKVILNTQFKINSDKFIAPTEANKEIKRFAKYVIDENLYVVVEGHTSSEGKAKSNLILSQKRADRIKQELIKLGVKSDKIVSLGYGESMPMSSKSTDAKNRRIETDTFKSIDKFKQYIKTKKDFISKHSLDEK